jgi:hypothetical protein
VIRFNFKGTLQRVAEVRAFSQRHQHSAPALVMLLRRQVGRLSAGSPRSAARFSFLQSHVRERISSRHIMGDEPTELDGR